MRNWKTIVAVGAVVVALILGVGAYSVLRAPEAATAPITAIPLTENENTAASASSASAAPTATESSATADGADAAVTSPPETATTDAPASAAAATTDVPASATAVPAGAILAQIVPDESEARFIIDEVLNNEPKTVIGTTNQVAGEIAVDPQNPDNTRVGVIQVNARTLTTDNDFRNRAIKNRILFTDQYEFVTFTPTEIKNLPQSGAVGQSYSFQITGDLTIRDVTKPVTFDVTATPESETRLKGTATTTISYAEWNITIPQVRQVASVSDQVRLEIDFVAVPK